ncbi:unnamed protein product [Schistosoma margrebowiei]|uniref:Uncharacterized protein n=1 Tax=Schistosoma margrebowiei TaxID=48269 RepID=A0A183MEH6_9TREM|nr:unnamed protein product [Schistosoma margrebowiei]
MRELYDITNKLSGNRRKPERPVRSKEGKVLSNIQEQRNSDYNNNENNNSTTSSGNSNNNNSNNSNSNGNNNNNDLNHHLLSSFSFLYPLQFLCKENKLTIKKGMDRNNFNITKYFQCSIG